LHEPRDRVPRRAYRRAARVAALVVHRSAFATCTSAATRVRVAMFARATMDSARWSFSAGERAFDARKKMQWFSSEW